MKELSKLQELSFELVEIDSIEENGYANTIDISVTGKHDFILGNGIITHNSALAGLVPSLGREEFAYYCLRGKPLNVWTASQSKFTANKELSTLYKIIKSLESEELMEDGDFYKITVDGKEIVVNENDSVKINGKWINVKELINENSKD